MESLFNSYIHCFLKFAQVSLEKSIGYNEIVPYANLLNEKANQLLVRASLNKNIDTQKLQRVLFESGREYIKKFAFKFNYNKIPDKARETFQI